MVTPPPTDADFYSCADEPRAQPYMKGMAASSQAGAFMVKVLDSTFTDPSGTHSEAPAKGNNVWTVEVADAVTTAPLDGVTLVVTPRMPDHPHGTKLVGITPLGAGTYKLEPLYLFMAGLWQITIDLRAARAAPSGDDAAVPGDAGAPASQVQDSVMFPICISG